MTPALGALVAAVGAAGVLLVIHGLRGTGERREQRRALDWPALRNRVAATLVAAIVGWAVTGWPAVGVMAGAAAYVVPSLLEVRRARLAQQAKTESLAGWAEMLRDTIGSHAGLREAIGVTAGVAPEPIRPAVRRLAARAEHESLSLGLRRFAQEVADPIGDLIVAALIVAAEGQARNLPALLSEIAGSARAEAHMRLRVETGRARTYSSSRALVLITLGLSVGLLIGAPAFMAPFRTALGQLVLLLITAFFVAALWGLVALGRPATSPRLLAGVVDGWDEVGG